MHAAALGDTLGIGFVLIGLMIHNGLTFVSLKLLLIIIFFWMASPVCSHLISNLEVQTNPDVEKECEIIHE
jgi:multicomponent Na+:H+ antiporter subunit G